MWLILVFIKCFMLNICEIYSTAFTWNLLHETTTGYGLSNSSNARDVKSAILVNLNSEKSAILVVANQSCWS